MQGAVNPAFQEDSEEESEMRGGVNDSTLVARRHQATVTTRGENSHSPTLSHPKARPYIPLQPVPTGICVA